MPQSLPAAPASSHPTTERYARQQEIGRPGITVAASVVRGLAGGGFPPPYSYEQARPSRDHAGQLRALQRHYAILASDRLIIELLEDESALYALLLEADTPLHHAFGEKRVLQVRVLLSDDDRLIRVAVQLPADPAGDPERALRAFDGDWWLSNCHRSGGALVFDYEIQDTV
jgi:hypothetical protein